MKWGDNMSETKLYDAIKADLLDQLDRAGRIGNQYKDLVNDYMTMWEAKNGVAADLKKNGVVRTRYYSNGTSTQENSKSVEQFIKLNSQMLTLLEKLKLDEPQMCEDEEM